MSGQDTCQRSHAMWPAPLPHQAPLAPFSVALSADLVRYSQGWLSPLVCLLLPILEGLFRLPRSPVRGSWADVLYMYALTLVQSTL